MKLFKLTSENSRLVLNLEHPIHLDEDSNYFIGLSGFYSDNFVLNFGEYTKKCFGVTENDDTTYYGFDKGYYTFDEIKGTFENCVKDFKQSHSLTFNENDFEIKPVFNKIQIKSPVKIILEAIMTDLLGFDETQATIEADKVYLGNKTPKFRPFDVIEIHCNLVEPSFEIHSEHSHKESEILYTFFPNVAYKSKISEKPNEIDYIPIRKNVKSIRNITLTIQDSEGYLLKNECKTTIYLRLKRE